MSIWVRCTSWLLCALHNIVISALSLLMPTLGALHLMTVMCSAHKCYISIEFTHAYTRCSAPRDWYVLCTTIDIFGCLAPQCYLYMCSAHYLASHWCCVLCTRVIEHCSRDECLSIYLRVLCALRSSFARARTMIELWPSSDVLCTSFYVAYCVCIEELYISRLCLK